MPRPTSSPVPRPFATKLRPPRIRFALVDRPRLVELVDEVGAVGLFLVHAPAGYGKTSLLLQWQGRLAERGVPTAWLTLDEDDDDPARLLFHLSAALGGGSGAELSDSALPGLEEGMMPRAGGASLDPVPLPKPPFVLFLDDFDRVGSEASRSILARLADRFPDGAAVVIGSRGLPHLGVGRRRLAGTMVEIDARTLRFVGDEVGAFMASRGTALAAELLEALFERTEGWAGALQLAALALRDGRRDRRRFVERLSGARGDLASYLGDEVLRSLGARGRCATWASWPHADEPEPTGSDLPRSSRP